MGVKRGRGKRRIAGRPITAMPVTGVPIAGTTIEGTLVEGTMARTSTGLRHVRRLRIDASWSDPANRALFLDYLAATCNVTASAQAAGLNPSGAYKLRAQDAEFEAQWYGAREQARDHLWMLLHQHAAAKLEPAADRARRIAALEGDPDTAAPSPVEASVVAGLTEVTGIADVAGLTDGTSLTDEAVGGPDRKPHEVDPTWAMALLKLHKDEETRAEGRRKDGRRGTRHVPLSADALRVLIFEKLSVRNKELGGDG